MQAFTHHGGGLAAAARSWPNAPQPWVDLSTGINPRPYPAPRATRSARTRLPYPEEILELEATAGRGFGVGDPSRVIATAGAEIGLRWLPFALGARDVCVLSPSYASHALAWTEAGARLVSQDQAAVVVLVNPNNPDGRMLTVKDLLARADALEARDGWLIVDESFIEASDVESVAPAGHPRVVVIRSFGKFHGLAGVRLGFLIGAPDLMARVRRIQGDWPVSADAISAGVAAYEDAGWRQRTQRQLAHSASRLDTLLKRSGFDIVGGTTLFRLARAGDAAKRFVALAERGILTRPFDYDPAWLRFGLPGPSAADRVEAALGAIA